MTMNEVKFSLEITKSPDFEDTILVHLFDTKKSLQITEVYKKPSSLWYEMRNEHLPKDRYIPQYGIIDNFLSSLNWVPGSIWISKVIELWNQKEFDKDLLKIKAIIDFYSSDVNIRLNPVSTLNFEDCFIEVDSTDVDPIGDSDAMEGELLIPFKDYEDNESLPFGEWLASHSYAAYPDGSAVALHYGKPINIFKNGSWTECTCEEIKSKIADNSLTFTDKFTLNIEAVKKFYHDVLKYENCN